MGGAESYNQHETQLIPVNNIGRLLGAQRVILVNKSWLALIFLVLLAAGCSDAAGSPATPPIIQFTPQTAPTGLLPPTPLPNQANSGPDLARPDLASSDLVIGPERFVFVLISTKTGKPINGVPAVGLQFLRVNAEGTATKGSDAAR